MSASTSMVLSTNAIASPLCSQGSYSVHSRCVAARVVSQRLGHSAVTFTLDRSGHVLPAQQMAAAEAFDAAVSGPDSDMRRVLGGLQGAFRTQGPRTAHATAASESSTAPRRTRAVERAGVLHVVLDVGLLREISGVEVGARAEVVDARRKWGLRTN